MEQVSVINILWEKIDFDFKLFETKNEISDSGFYQVYGHHPAYGDDALLYIGRTVDQTFAARLAGRWEFIESSCRPTCIRLGRIVESPKKGGRLEWSRDDWQNAIVKIESLLIKAHVPAMNKQENSGLLPGETNEHYLVLNWGDFGSLLPEVSTFKMSYKYWDFEKPLGIAR